MKYEAVDLDVNLDIDTQVYGKWLQPTSAGYHRLKAVAVNSQSFILSTLSIKYSVSVLTDVIKYGVCILRGETFLETLIYCAKRLFIHRLRV